MSFNFQSVTKRCPKCNIPLLKDGTHSTQYLSECTAHQVGVPLRLNTIGLEQADSDSDWYPAPKGWY